MEFFSSGRRCPSAILAAMRARGYPVALLASAEERDSRAFTSMTRYRSERGSRANWMLHSPTIPKCLITLKDRDLRKKYSSSLRVCDGATTIDSPVCTPSGSIFSMLHTVMQLSAASRTTSYSSSFHPVRSSSIRTWGEPVNASVAMRRRSDSLRAMPEPRPPRVNAVRIMTG